MKTIIAIAVAAAALVQVTPASAQSVPAEASLRVQRGLSVATVRPMRLVLSPGQAALSITGSSLADAPAMIQVSGDPGRVYRIRLPQPAAGQGAASIENLSIWSANAGDISISRLSHMDMQGRDLLRVSGRLRPGSDPSGEPVAALPLSIDYE